MKKGDPTPEQIYVKYKGTRFLLPPGHKVFECDTNTGLVREHKLKWAFTWFWQKGRTYTVTYNYHIVHRPAFNIEKAIVEFKHQLKVLIEDRKSEGNPLKIKSAQ